MYKLSNIFSLIILTFSLFSCANKNANQKTNEIVIANQIPLEDFFKNPEKSSYQISPDGSFYSFMAPYKNRMNIFIQKIGDSSATQLTFEEARDIAGYFWPNNEQIVFLKDEAGDENFHLFGVNIDGSNPISFTDFEGVRAQIIDDLPDQKDFVVIGLNKRNKQVFDPYRLNLKTGEISMLAENPGNIQGWMFDHDGKLRIATAIVDGVNQSILYRENEEDEFKTIITTNFKEGFNPQFFTFDNKNIIGSSNLGRDKSAIVEFDPTTAKEVRVLYANDDYDVNGVGYSRKRKVITAAYFESWKSERHYFDSTSKKIFEKIQKQLAGYEIGITGVNKDENILILRTYSDKSLGAYYIYNSEDDKMEKIVDVSPWIDENEMSNQLPVDYQSRDGLNINGYLTLPKGYNMENAKNLPVVINPHGGPWARDTPNSTNDFCDIYTLIMRKTFGGDWQGNVEIEINNHVEYVGSFVAGGYRRSEPISFGVRGNDEVRVIANGLNGFDEYYTVQNGLGDTIIDFNLGNSPTIIVQPCYFVGLENPDINQNIKIYPNPTRDILFINSISEIKNIIITNIYGQIVYENYETGLNFELDLSNLSNNLYHISFTDANNIRSSSKIMVSH